MLDFFRSKVGNSIAIKIVLGIIIIAFVLVGVVDSFKKAPSDYVFKIEDYKCSEKEFIQALNRQVAYISQNLGRPVSQEQLVNNGIYESVLNNLIDKRMLLLEAQKINLVVSDSMVQKSIMSHPAFKNKDGAFDKAAFQEFMEKENISEQDFISMIRDESMLEILLNSLSANSILAPQEVRQLMISSQSSKELTLYKINRKNHSVSNNASDEELKATLEKHKNDFMTKETRDLTYVSFSPSDVVKEKSVISDKELLDGYEQRKFMFEQPETRAISHVISQTKEIAQKAKDALLSGKAFDAVVKEYGYKQIDYKMPKVTKESLTKEMSDVVFSMKENEYSEPIKGPVGYHVFLVEKITPSEFLPFEKVKESLKEQMQNEKDFEKFSTFLRSLDSEISSGASIESISAKYGFKLDKVSNIINDAKNDGSISRSYNFLQAAFSLNANQTSNVSVAEESKYFIVRADSIEPSKQMEFNDIKGKLMTLWREDTIDSRMIKAADQLKAELMLGKTPNVLYDSSVLKFSANEKSMLPVAIINKIAYLKKGEFSQIELDNEKNYIFVLIGDTIYPDVSKFPDLNRLIQPDRHQRSVIIEQYISHLRAKYKVEINKEYFNDGTTE